MGQHRRCATRCLVALLSFTFISSLVGVAVVGSPAPAGAAGRKAAVGELRRESAQPATIVLDSRTGTVEWLQGRYAPEKPGDPRASALRFVEAHAPAFGLRAPSHELVPLAAPLDPATGGRDAYFGQRLAGLPVWNAVLTVHFDAAGMIRGASGELAASQPVVTTPAISGDQARDLAADALGAVPSAATWSPVKELAVEAAAISPAVASTPRLVLFPDQVGAVHLAFEVRVRRGAFDTWTVLVDARSGKTLLRAQEVRTAAGSARGYGIDQFGHKVSLNDYRTSTGGFKLVDRSMYMFKHHTANHPYTSFEGSIEIRDAKHVVDAQGSGIPKANYPTVADKNKDNFFNHGGSDEKLNQRSAVSLARNLATTYKAFKTRLGRNSLDGKGIAVIGNVHLGNEYENAYWQPQRKMMFFGDNKDTEAPFAKSADVVAHEFGHGVTQYSVKPDGMVYMYPSGAIDESMSDAWGCMTDYQDWLIGENLGSISRDLVTPANGDPPLPASMDEFNLLVLPVDGGGNHINCGIGGHFYQQLAAALPATPPAADGRFTAAKIVYRAYAYLDATSDFRDWAIGLSQAATDLYGAGSAQGVATRDVLEQLGMGYLDVEQNDNGWCLNDQGALQWVMFGYGVSSDFLCVKFQRPAGAKLYRGYAALDPGAKPSTGAFDMYVVGVGADGGPNPNNIIDSTAVDMDGILPLGNFTPVQFSPGEPAAAAIDVPSQYFLCIGYTDSLSPYDYGVLLTDNGAAPTDSSWWLHYDAFSGQWQKQPYHTMTGSHVNFMLRPMYYYSAGPG